MKTVKDLIDSIDKEEKLLKGYEQKNDIENCKATITNIISIIDTDLQTNHFPDEEIKVFNTLKKSYLNKLKNYSYYTILITKEQVIQKNLKEKYLNNKGPNTSFVDYQGNYLNESNSPSKGFIKLKQNNKLIGKDFEVVNPDQIMLTEICNTCDSLLKKYDEEFNTKSMPSDEFVNQLKTSESFYVYEVKKDNQDKKIVMKYINSIKHIKDKCELLKASRIKEDIKAVIKLEEEIKTIDDEIFKINIRNQSQLNHIKKSKLKSNTLPIHSNISINN